MGKKLYRNEAGMAAVISALFILILIALAGLLIDGGLLIYHRIRLEAATEAAAMATIASYNVYLWEEYGIVELDPFLAEVYAREYLVYNMPEAILDSVEVNPLQRNQAILKTKMEVETIFMRAFGINSRIIRTVVRSVGG